MYSVCAQVRRNRGGGGRWGKGILYLNSTRSPYPFENHPDPLTGCK